MLLAWPLSRMSFLEAELIYSAGYQLLRLRRAVSREHDVHLQAFMGV
jgi:hypothetical protein